MNGDLISRYALRKSVTDELERLSCVLYKHNDYFLATQKAFDTVLDFIDNAPSVEKPKSEYEFIEILAQNVPEDLCTYPEYKGKPYYSIHYKENGEEFVGFGTYNPEVLSRYLKEYFMKGDKE